MRPLHALQGQDHAGYTNNVGYTISGAKGAAVCKADEQAGSGSQGSRGSPPETLKALECFLPCYFLLLVSNSLLLTTNSSPGPGSFTPEQGRSKWSSPNQKIKPELSNSDTAAARAVSLSVKKGELILTISEKGQK